MAEDKRREEASRLLNRLDPELDGIIERIGKAEGLSQTDRGWLSFALGSLWQELKQTAKGPG